MRNSERSTFAAERLVKMTCDRDRAWKNQPRKSKQRWHVVNSIGARLERRLIAKLGWPVIGIVWMSHVPADPSFADAALQILNVVGPAAVFAVFPAAPGRQILGRLCFVSSTHRPSLRTRVDRLILQRLEICPAASPARRHR